MLNFCCTEKNWKKKTEKLFMSSCVDGFRCVWSQLCVTMSLLRPQVARMRWNFHGKKEWNFFYLDTFPLWWDVVKSIASISQSFCWKYQTVFIKVQSMFSSCQLPVCMCFAMNKEKAFRFWRLLQTQSRCNLKNSLLLQTRWISLVVTLLTRDCFEMQVKLHQLRHWQNFQQM